MTISHNIAINGAAGYADSVSSGGGTSTPVADPNTSKYVSLLLNGDGTNGAQNQTFIDSSSNNATITRYGDATQGSFGPFGNSWSNYFDGTGDYLTYPTNSTTAINGTENFTIEAWLNPSAVTTYHCFYSSQWAVQCYMNANQKIEIAMSVSATSGAYFTTQQSSGTIPLNQWSHVVIARVGNNFNIFINGVLDVTHASTGGSIAVATTSSVGSVNNTNLYTWNGYISNLRIVKGTALYTSNFTPSTTPLTAVAGTSLLTCQSNRFKDNSTNNAAITVYGNTKVVKDSPFPEIYDKTIQGASAYFDGAGDYLTVPTSAALQLSSSDFTIDTWVNVGIVSQSPFIGKWSGSAGEFYLGIIGSNLAIGLSSTGTTSSPTWIQSTGYTIPTNTWIHVAAVRSGTTISLYINGTLNVSGTFSGSVYTGTTQVMFGRNPDNGQSYTGYISNLRIIKGTALYTANFTPSTSPLTVVANTSLLLKCDNAGIYDATGKNDLVTYGNAQVSTGQKKYGTGAMYFDGTGDYLTIPSNQNFVFGTGNFTIEAWVNPTVGGTWRSIVACRAGLYTTSTEWVFGVHSSGYLYFYTDGQKFNTTSTIYDAIWYHIALVRNGSNLMLFINGTIQQTVTHTQNLTFSSCSIGSNYDGTEVFTGYIDDLRITKGIARYTANFTPPAAPLTL
jgi:hypothetical protein